jgi:hypothetical protein
MVGMQHLVILFTPNRRFYGHNRNKSKVVNDRSRLREKLAYTALQAFSVSSPSMGHANAKKPAQQQYIYSRTRMVNQYSTTIHFFLSKVFRKLRLSTEVFTIDCQERCGCANCLCAALRSRHNAINTRRQVLPWSS